jgi:hypothetical protein
MGLETEKIIGKIDKAMSSPGKLKILRLLMKQPDHAFTRYEIGKKIQLRPADIKNDLAVLIEVGWVKEFRLQNLQKYSINLDTELVKQFTEFFKRIRYL